MQLRGQDHSRQLSCPKSRDAITSKNPILIPFNSCSPYGPVNATVKTDYYAHGHNSKKNQPNIQRDKSTVNFNSISEGNVYVFMQLKKQL